MGKYTGQKYEPSNGTEGCSFQEEFCGNCLHEKFWHTQKHGDKQCEILNNAILYRIDEPQYPTEWQYNENDIPVCTAWVKWDWFKGDDDNGLNEPPPIIPDDPRQLCLPFIIEEINQNIEIPKPELV